MELQKIEKIIEEKLGQLSITFDQVNLQDDDINYYLEIEAKNFIEELRDVGKIPVLMYINVKKETITIFCTNLYKKCEKESIIKTMNVINSVNNAITYGKLFLNKTGTVIYQNTFQVSEADKLDTYISAFVIAVWIFYCEMKKYEEKNIE